jgi:hypothetical protein
MDLKRKPMLCPVLMVAEMRNGQGWSTNTMTIVTLWTPLDHHDRARRHDHLSYDSLLSKSNLWRLLWRYRNSTILISLIIFPLTHLCNKALINHIIIIISSNLNLNLNLSLTRWWLITLRDEWLALILRF